MSRRVTKAEASTQVPKDPLLEIGAPGLQIYSGYVQEEFLPELSGNKAMRVFREMALNDGMIGAILFAIRMLIRQVDWHIRPASPEPEDEVAAEFLRTCQQDMTHSWTEFLDDLLWMLTYGFALHECVYKRRRGISGQTPSRFSDDRIGWARLPVRSQLSVLKWEHDEWGRDILGVWQTFAPPKFESVYIPSDRLLLFRPTAYRNNPEGMSILRTAYRSWFFKKRVENFEGIGVERDLAGIPVIGLPPMLFDPNAPAGVKAQLEQWKKIATNLRVNEQTGLVIPRAFDPQTGNELYKVELLSTGARRMFDTNSIINRYDQRIAMSVLADFILIGHEKAGSFALNSSKTELFAVAVGAWLDAIQDVFNRQAVPRLFALNPEFKLEALPTFQHGDTESIDLAELGAFITALSGSGMLSPDEQLENHLRRTAGLPTLEAEER